MPHATFAGRAMCLVTLAAVAGGAGAARAQELRHERYQLPNGMTVILHEDHALPVASVNLWYRVGARNEPPHRSGFAHLFEHLMFMGTKRVPGSDFDNLMERGGGSNNASTELDRTNYFSSGPSGLLPTLLWLDADRLEDLGSYMTKEKLDLQRDVVRNERRQSVENAPYGRAYEATYQLMYPASHPYHNGVIGTHEDLEAATTEDVKNFFATFYTPANCSLVVAGDFDPKAIRPMVADLFGTLPRGNAPEQEGAPEPTVGRVLRTTSLDKVELPLIEFDYHSPGNYKPGDAEMKLLAKILDDGPGSRLYDRLVTKEQLAVDIDVSQDGAALGSIFRVGVKARPDADPARVEAVMDEELARIVKDGPSDAEVRRQAATFEHTTLLRLQNVQARADKLNEYLYYYGEPDSLKRDLDRYRNATGTAVREWAGKVLTPGSRLISVVLPEEPQRAGEGGTSARDAAPKAREVGAGGAARFVPPMPVATTLANGVPVQVWTRPGLGLVQVSVVFRAAGPGGRPASVDDPAAPGVADLACELTQQGAGGLDSAAYADALRSLGASVTAGAQTEAVTVSLSTLARNAGPAAKLMADSIVRPRMTPDDFARVQRVAVADREQEKRTPQFVAARVAARMLMSESSAYGMPTAGTPESVRAATLDAVVRTHRALFTPANATILVAGAITPDEAKSVLDAAFAGWQAAAPTATPSLSASAERPPLDTSMRASDGLRVFFVDRPGAVQTAVQFMGPGLPVGDAGRVPSELACVVLGGTFTSRLNHNLREVHGYTYGARARVDSRAGVGFFSAAAAVRADATGAALGEFIAELKKLGGGDVTGDELTKARETARHKSAESFASLGATLGEAADALVTGGGFDRPAKDLAALDGVTVEGVNAAAGSLFKRDRSVLVLVGDRALVLEQIKDLGLPAPVVVDEEGRPITAGGSDAQRGR